MFAQHEFSKAPNSSSVTMCTDIVIFLVLNAEMSLVAGEVGSRPVLSVAPHLL